MRKIHVIIFVIILIVSLFGCAGPEEQNTYTLAAKESPDIVRANIKFSFELLKKLNDTDKDKNVIISPYSISSALSMTYLGARGKTKEEMAAALYYSGISDDDFRSGQKYLKSYFEGLDKKVETLISNSLWIREGENVNQTFIDANSDIFDAGVQTLDFSDPSSVDTINKWISKSTKGMIEKMLSHPIRKDVFMYLINAVYFKGEWSKSFDPKKTIDMDFRDGQGIYKKAKMMHQKGEFFYSSKDEHKIISIPYGDEKISMFCILPEGNEDVNDFIAKLDQKKWDEMRNELKKTEDVSLYLPKFKLEYGIRELKEELKKAGMEIAFTSNADFTGIAEDLFISSVLHKAVIELDEKGTKAAAATVVTMTKSAAKSDSPEFIADRPFIFIIADNRDGSILFLGKVISLG